MQTKRNKFMAISIVLLLTISMMAAISVLPSAIAHTPSWNVPTFAHIYATINPIGVGQQEPVYLFLTPTYADTSITNNYRFHNYKLIITAPNGAQTTQTVDTVIDTTSNQIFTFTPDQVGTYTLQFIFPGQAVNDYPHSNSSAYLNDYYMASNATTTLTVQPPRAKTLFDWPE